MPDREELRKLDRETLIDLLEDAAKLWLAHDGLWFQAVEANCGMETAIRLDAEAWRWFTEIEAGKIMKRHDIAPGGGLAALEKALSWRQYARINEQKTTRESADTLVFEMTRCRVQEARKRKNLPDFPCKPVGLVEYSGFAGTIDDRITTRCITCPPDDHGEECWCKWEFTLSRP